MFGGEFAGTRAEAEACWQREKRKEKARVSVPVSIDTAQAPAPAPAPTAAVTAPVAVPAVVPAEVEAKEEASALKTLGHAAFKAGRYSEAAQLYGEAAEADPTDAAHCAKRYHIALGVVVSEIVYDVYDVDVHIWLI